MDKTRRNFIKKTSLVTGGLTFGIASGLSAKSYRKILGSNDRVRVGIVGFSNRAKGALIPAFVGHQKKMNFEIVGVSDIWNRRRDEGSAYIKEKAGNNVTTWRNNEEMYDDNKIDAVIISTADFQHALHTVQAANAKKDAYVEKPFAETMEDARLGRKAVEEYQPYHEDVCQQAESNRFHRSG